MIKVCHLWGYTDTPFKSSNWKWSECQLIQEVCAVWGTKDASWINANWKWSQCTSSFVPPTPTFGSLQPDGPDATTLIQPWLIEPWNPYRANDEHDRKRKRLIRLICKVKGEVYNEEKRIGDIRISVDDVKMVVRAVSGIDLNVKMEK